MHHIHKRVLKIISKLSEMFPTQSTASSKENCVFLFHRSWKIILVFEENCFFQGILDSINSLFQKHNKKKQESVIITADDMLPAYEVKHSEIFGRWVTHFKHMF